MSEHEHNRLIRESRERSELLDAILDGLAEGVLATDLDGRVLFANPAARKILGMGEERVRSFEEPQDLPDPFSDFDLRKAVARCAEEGECPEVMASKEGSPLRVRLRRLERFDEHRGGVLVIVHQLSDARRMEVNQQRFLSVAAHELRTPLTAILGSAELLRDEEDPETRLRFLGLVENEARRAYELSETLLRLARTGYDQREPHPEEVDTLAAARGAAERMGPLARGVGVKLRVEGEGGRARADRAWLEQVLLAVLDNAVKYSDRGGTVRVRASGGSIAVRDEGPGISKADLPHVFDLFHRGERSGPRADTSGAGLGLSVARDLVERMGGSISAESEEDLGTTIRIELPGATDR